MTILLQESQWFETLTKSRSKGADLLEQPFMRGVQRSVVDKYSDQAHFIYELLQNADDVKAKIAKFRLESNSLYFKHDGSILFSVSDPEREDIDTINGTLGHINAITSIANSNKMGASIGKFGVGFKAVFQYTQTPHIYDPKIRFKIERFIVPHMLSEDIDWREPSETVFFFPFDHKLKNFKDSYDEILLKLKALEFPVLFLSNLQVVSFEAKDIIGKYTKKITKKTEKNNIVIQWVTLTLEVNDEKLVHKLLVFTKKTENGYPCSLSYAFGSNGELVPISRPAFCFFPTKETTNLNFIIHAPFLLTDSREGIKAGESHNQKLIQGLAELAAESLLVLRDEKLIDDNLFDIIPYDDSRFSDLNDRSKISFLPFFEKIRDKIKTDKLLPTQNGECSSRAYSYWASDTELVSLFSDQQLAQLIGEKDVHWIFCSRGWKEVQNTNKQLANYIDGGDYRSRIRKVPNLIVASLDPEAILKKITDDFIASQPLSWLHRFYAYLFERESYQKFVKDKPIFLDENGNAVAAFDDNKQLVLFLPDDDIDGYTTINHELLSNDVTCEFVEKFGIKKPSLRDEIYNKILPEYDVNESINTSPHFMKFFRYFKECPNDQVDEFINLIKEKEFLLFSSFDDQTIYRGIASDLYLPTLDLKVWFEPKPSTRFLSLDTYYEMVGSDDEKCLDEFLRRLGVLAQPRVLTINNSDRKIDGLDELFLKKNSGYSNIVWKVLSESWSRYETSMKTMKHRYGPRGGYKGGSWSDTSVSLDLRTKDWMLNNLNQWVSADAVTIQSLSNQYDTTSAGAEAFIRFLGIADETQGTAHLSEEEVRKIKLAEEIEQSGLSEDEIRTAIEDAKHKKNAKSSMSRIEGGSEQTSTGSTLIQEIENRRSSARQTNSLGHQENDQQLPTQSSDANEDTDEYTPKVVDYSKKFDRAKDRCAQEIDRLEREQSLLNKANSLPKYTYGWFLALLELECMASSEKNADNKTISIGFGKVERDSNSSRTIVLKEPSRFIPQSIEEMSGVRLDIVFGDGKSRSIHIESFTAKEFLLVAKVASSVELGDIEFSEAVEARIEIQNPSFLLQQLLERFRELKLDDKFNMKTNLTADIEFIFGPPGTGKTTHLAERVLIPLMQRTEPQKILVLTPTNKAADVLTTRIIEKMGSETSYLNWLVRFGTSNDERIETAGVWRERSFDIGKLKSSVTVTTIARFAYDGFNTQYGSKKLHDIKWDVIVIDEASMITLPSIIYPLYCQKPNAFIVAGDPFQIEPIVAVEQWKDENIYTLVGLNKAGAFANPVTEPHNYKVTNLEIQYRSIPSIGELFSHFTYDGSLKHYRKFDSQRTLKLKGVDIKPLNIIKFPVSKFESIYRAKRLDSGTPYQSYSALFTFEFVCWIATQIQDSITENFRIGIIAPYRAQASLLSKLNDSWFGKPKTVEVQVGTIHGFQGDECDMIIAVFNPPPIISSSPQMFLNKQNILNVAISRARDYLFIVMPDDETEGVNNLAKLANIERLVRSSNAFNIYSANTIEKIIWDNANYLEDNTFSTGHQMVNVYRKPERYYEVRSDESAIDIQIHGHYDT